MRDIKDISCVCKSRVFAGAQDVMAAVTTQTGVCVLTYFSDTHCGSRPIGAPLQSRAHNFRCAQARTRMWKDSHDGLHGYRGTVPRLVDGSPS